MNIGDIVRTTYFDSVRLHRYDPIAHVDRRGKAFFFSCNEVGIVIEKKLVTVLASGNKVESLDEYYNDVYVWSILTQQGKGYILMHADTISKFLTQV